MGLIQKLFGTTSEREVKKLRPIIDRIEALAEPCKALSDEDLRHKTVEFKERLANGETLDDLLPEAFAAVREAAWRVLGMRPYRVQLIGGVILHQGRIAEMKTGEGKTLVAILPAYLNALKGEGVHIVTVNDYLAKRDSEWMGKVYRFMGLKVGLIIHDMTPDQRRQAYLADITYCTNNELGFDYLRDNMALYKKDQVQRGHSFAIVDEVDSILIDEARTPLIISGKGDDSSKLYEMADFFVSRLKRKVYATTDDKEAHDDDNCDYYVDEKARSVQLTAEGIRKAEEYFNVENLADLENATLSHHINQAMRARGLMKRDVDYVVKDGQVIIVDESTGRLMYGRRYNEGLHQAIEAKEGVEVASESKTLATITFQNFFRLYSKLSGMTGTAMTELEEFEGIYALDVVEIPTNKPVIRKDYPDVVYKTEAGKLRAVIEQIKQALAEGRLKPGDRLPAETELEVLFGVSRGSIRQAMKSLEMLGVVTIRPGDGTYVNDEMSRNSFNPLIFALLLIGISGITGLKRYYSFAGTKVLGIVSTLIVLNHYQWTDFIIAKTGGFTTAHIPYYLLATGCSSALCYLIGNAVLNNLRGCLVLRNAK